MELCQSSRNPHMGFCVQRTDRLGTSEKLTPDKGASGIIGGNTFIGIHVLHTSYLKFLQSSFGFRDNPIILHAIFYRHAPYLRQEVLGFLTLRQELKRQGTLDSLARANFLKLVLNSIYGYCLCRKGWAFSLV